MPGLPFTQLPATEQENTMTPESMLNQGLMDLQTQAKSQEEELKRIKLTDKQFAISIRDLQTNYNRQKSTIQNGQKQLRTVQGLVSQGLITSEAGERAMWRMVLPQDVEREMFPTGEPPSELGTPYSMTQITKLEESAKMFAEDAPWAYDPWGTIWDINKPRATKDLITQYLSFRNRLGYDYMSSIAKKKHIDDVWDATMRSSEGFQARPAKEIKGKMINLGWDPDKPEIQALRQPVGKLQGTMGKFVSPMGRSVVKNNKPQRSITPPSRNQLLAKYEELGGSDTIEGRKFADEHLR